MAFSVTRLLSGNFSTDALDSKIALGRISFSQSSQSLVKMAGSNVLEICSPSNSCCSRGVAGGEGLEVLKSGGDDTEVLVPIGDGTE